jgi:D-arabinose 1-dehydrogenase-like Zn-dependent alcohol dehydrogenase
MLKVANRNVTGQQVAVDGVGGVAAAAVAVRKAVRRRIGRMSVRAAAPQT